MEKDIVDGKLGTVGAYDLEFKDGELRLTIDVNAPLGIGTAGLKLGIKADAVLDAIANAIPGQIDDAVINLIKSALKADI